MSLTKPLLYSFSLSSCSWRVRSALNLKRIDYDIESVDILKDGTSEAAFAERSATKMVPTLFIDGEYLIESMNILHYLEETRPKIPLLPVDPKKRASVRGICEIISSGIQPFQNLSTLKMLNQSAEKQTEWVHFFINRGFAAIEKILSKTAGKYCIGDELTLADCCLVPQVFSAKIRFHVDMKPYPKIMQIDHTLQQLPEIQLAHPFVQPDCPAMDKKLEDAS